MDVDSIATITRVCLVLACGEAAGWYGRRLWEEWRGWQRRIANASVAGIKISLAVNFCVALATTVNGAHPVNTLWGLLPLLACVMIQLFIAMPWPVYCWCRISAELGVRVILYAGVSVLVLAQVPA